MRKFNLLRKAILPLLILLVSFAFGQAQNGTIRGMVRDDNGPLNGASVSLNGGGKGTTTNAAGEYELKAKPGKYTVTITYVGSKPFTSTVNVTANQVSNVDATVSATGTGEDIVIVGSRTAGRSKLSTAVPVDVITSKELKNYGQVDASQILTYVAPSFQSSRQTVTDGTDHIDPAGLRGLGPDQTLVLVNGKRRHNSSLVNINGSVGRGSVGTDLNAIPVASIERIEVLRDGAAAQYGSDAIAGVINIVLKKAYQGLTVSATNGENFTHLNYGPGRDIHDGANSQYDFYAGTRIGKNGGNIVFSGQFLGRGATNRSGNDNIPLIYYGNAGGLPTLNATPALSANDQANFRRYVIDLDRRLIAERHYDRHNIVAGNSANNNTGFFVNGGIPINSRTEVYFTGGISHRTGAASGFSRNPNSFAQQPVTAAGNLFYSDGFLPQIHTRLDDGSIIGGIKTKFGKWDVDLSHTFGVNKLFYNIQNTGNASLPGSNAVQTSFDAGGLRFEQNTTNLEFSKNLSHFGSFSSFNIAIGGELRFEQFQIASGELNSYANGGRQAIIPALPAYSGFNNQVVTFAPAPAGAGAQVFPGFGPFDALRKGRNVASGYVDLEGTIGQFLLGAAGRYEKYSDFGEGVGGKVSARVELSKNFAIRASGNAGFRAPSLQQRYFQNTSTQFVNGLPSQSLTANNDNLIVRNGFGVQQLKPEKSYSATAGVVAKIANNVTFTLDGYYINIKDRIVLSTPFNRSNPLVDSIVKSVGDPTLINGVNAVQFWTNAVDTRTFGVDAVITNRIQLRNGVLNLSLAGNYNDNKVTNLHTNSKIDDPANNPSLTDPTKNPANDLKNILFDRLQISRIEVAQPKIKVNLTANFQIKKFDITAREVYFGQTKFVNSLDPNALKVDGTPFNDILPDIDQTFSPRIITDLNVNYHVYRGITFGVGANNLFDIYPDRIFIDPRNDLQGVYTNPIATSFQNAGGYSAGRDASNRGRFLYNGNQFGYNGRYLYARATVDFAQFLKKKAKPVVVEPPVIVVPIKDRDGDGVPDDVDDCPDQAGPAALKGCPDRDGDGIADKDDACPDVPGIAKYKGCPIPDTDKDGINDEEDKCPTVAGVARYQGCPVPDTDGDGVNDEEDKCPNEAGPASNFGCPVIKTEVIEKVNTAAKNIFFATGSAKLLAKSFPSLNNVVKVLADNPTYKVEIQGHTDITGTHEKNMLLSEQRAGSVRDYLLSKSVNSDRLSVKGFGPDKPIADNKTPAGRAKNRRVEMILTNY